METEAFFLKGEADYQKFNMYVIITGARGSGKSTLLKEVIASTDIGRDISGIITWCEPKVAVYMRQLGSDEAVTIGTYNTESTSAENRMMPVKSAFDEYGVKILDLLINGSLKWVLLDEVGYLESSSEKYIDKLGLLFERKRVIAVVRKQETDLIKKIVSQKNALIIDLDEPRECTGN